MTTAAARAPRRGSTLVAVLTAIVVATLAGTAAATLGKTLQADARGSAAALHARTAAEGALATTLANWPSTWTTALVPGGYDTRTTTSPSGTATVRALRLDVRRYLLTAAASTIAAPGPLGAAVRRAGLFARLDNVAYTPPAALIAAGPMTLAADTDVRGNDAPPPTWADCTSPPESPPAAAAATPGLRLMPGARIAGAALTDSTAWSTPTLERFGDVDRATLAARADVVIPAGSVLSPNPRSTSADDPSCLRDRTSWGEPYRGGIAEPACIGDYPVVHLRGTGTTVITGPARFQGTLLVDGSLAVVGRVEAAGFVLIGGALHDSLGALVVDGAVVVRGGAATLGPGSRIRRSRCALDRAAAAAARPVPLGRRAWFDVVR